MKTAAAISLVGHVANAHPVLAVRSRDEVEEVSGHLVG